MVKKINFYKFDIDDGVYDRLINTKVVGLDTETTGLYMPPARLCLVQLYFPELDEVHMVHFPMTNAQELYSNSQNLIKLLSQESLLKIIHYARFDCLSIKKYLHIMMENVVCTKIMSQVCRTYTDKHGLKDLVKTILNKNIDKGQQTSDWGQGQLTEPQMEYAAQDVIYLNDLYIKLKEMCIRENRYELVCNLFNCITPFVMAEHESFCPDKIMNPFKYR